VKRQAVDSHNSQMTGLIDDDPDGFTVPPNLLDLCNRPFETYLTNGS
jgi:hypothetical protein